MTDAKGDQERLVELIDETLELYPSELKKLADYLIAHGVVVQKHGRWERKEGNGVYWHECSECQGLPPKQGDYRHFTDFCPNCGAKMDA